MGERPRRPGQQEGPAAEAVLPPEEPVHRGDGGKVGHEDRDGAVGVVQAPLGHRPEEGQRAEEHEAHHRPEQKSRCRPLGSRRKARAHGGSAPASTPADLAGRRPGDRRDGAGRRRVAAPRASHPARQWPPARPRRPRRRALRALLHRAHLGLARRASAPPALLGPALLLPGARHRGVQRRAPRRRAALLAVPCAGGGSGGRLRRVAPRLHGAERGRWDLAPPRRARRALARGGHRGSPRGRGGAAHPPAQPSPAHLHLLAPGRGGAPRGGAPGTRDPAGTGRVAPGRVCRRSRGLVELLPLVVPRARAGDRPRGRPPLEGHPSPGARGAAARLGGHHSRRRPLASPGGSAAPGLVERGARGGTP